MHCSSPSDEVYKLARPATKLTVQNHLNSRSRRAQSGPVPSTSCSQPCCFSTRISYTGMGYSSVTACQTRWIESRFEWGMKNPGKDTTLSLGLGLSWIREGGAKQGLYRPSRTRALRHGLTSLPHQENNHRWPLER